MGLFDFANSPEYKQFGSALQNLGQLSDKATENKNMLQFYANRPEIAAKFYGTQQGQAQTQTQQALAQAEIQKQQMEQQRQSALANVIQNLQPQEGAPVDSNLALLTKMASIDPQYAGALIKYKEQQQQASLPDWQTKEVGGSLVRFNAKDPNSIPTSVFTAPTQPKWETKEVNGQLVAYDANNPQAGVKPLSGQVGGGVDVKGEGELRKEFDNLNKDYRIVNDAYNKIQASASDPSAAGDLSLIFSYMKILDPSSTVREGEFATAQNAAGVPTQIQNLWNRAKTGERLAPEQRADFVNQAKNLYQAQAQTYSSGAEKYRELASQYGYNPDRIVKNLPRKDPAIEKEKERLKSEIARLKGKK